MVFQVVGHDGLCASIRSGLQHHFTRWVKQLRPPLAVGADWRSNAPQGPSSSFSAGFNVRWPEKINRCPNPPEPESKPAKAASWSAVRFTALWRIRQAPGNCFVLRAGPELRLNRFTAMAAHGKPISGIEPTSSAFYLGAQGLTLTRAKNAAKLAHSMSSDWLNRWSSGTTFSRALVRCAKAMLFCTGITSSAQPWVISMTMHWPTAPSFDPKSACQAWIFRNHALSGGPSSRSHWQLGQSLVGLQPHALA